MPTLLPFYSDGYAYGPITIKAMAEALERARYEFHFKKGNWPADEDLARLILKTAGNGQIEPDELCDAALAHFELSKCNKS